MQKLCYIVPESNTASPTHFAYLADFGTELGKHFELKIIEEKKNRVLLPFKLLLARFAGFRDFYVHYSFFAAFLSSLLVRVCGGRVFYWNCGLPWQYQRSFWREFFEKKTYQVISYLVTGTQGMKKLYAAHYQLRLEKIKVMPNWINLAKSKPIISENHLTNRRVVLFVHRLSERKGAHYLPHIINSFKNSNVVFLIVGDGPERVKIESEMKNLGLTSQVRFLGWIAQKEIPDYFAKADVFIMPSEEEGSPRVILETMVAGVPFVAFDVGGTREIVPSEFRDYLVKKGDLAGFVHCLETILAWPDEKKKKMSEIEKSWVRNYDLNEVIKIFINNVVGE